MSPLSTNDINTILTSKLNDKNFKFVSYEELDKGDIPIGFLSCQQKACIKYMSDGVEYKLYIFIKTLPPLTYHRTTVLNSGAFRKEVIVFSKFLKDLKRTSEEDPIPTCYLGRDDIVVLNDLSKKGFKNVPLFQTFTVSHCTKAFETLAKLHALALVFEIKNDCKLNEYIPILKNETIFTGDENNSTRKAVVVGLKALRALKNKYLPQYGEEITEKVFTYMSNIHEKMAPSTKYPNVLSHSDMWSNNVMFRYNSNGEVSEACVLDFQLASYRTLGYDLLMLLLCCTNKELRDEHFNYLMKHYYKILSDELSNEGCDLNNLLPWPEFAAMIDETAPVLLATAPQYLHFVLMPDEVVQGVLEDEEKWRSYYEIDRTEYTLKSAEEYPPYKTRVLEALSELFDYFLSQNYNKYSLAD